MNNQSLHLALCCDRNVADGLVTTIASVAAHLRPDFSLEIHVIDCGLGADIRARVTAVIRHKLPMARIEFIELHADRLKDFPQPASLSHVTLATYGRLFLHELLAKVEKVIYLDCDLLVTGDLAEIYLTPLNGFALAAVRDTVIPTVGHEWESLVKDLPGLRPDEPYFNAGVLLLNLTKLRDLDASALYAQLLRNVEARYADQSVLNGVFHGQWKAIPARWNRQVQLGREFSVFPDRPRAIWHFASKLKPWHFHRRPARGLLKQWQDQADAIGWVPTFEPTVQSNPPFLRDLVKQGRSWIECRESEHSVLPSTERNR